MTYFDYYLKFTGSEHARSVLYATDGMTQAYDATYDILGPWLKIDNTDPENPVTTPVDGFFVNVRSPAEIVWPDGVVSETPVTPWRVFA